MMRLICSSFIKRQSFACRFADELKSSRNFFTKI